MNESAASTTLKRIALFKVNKVPYLLEFNINWAAATHLTRVWSRWDELGKQAVGQTTVRKGRGNSTVSKSTFCTFFPRDLRPCIICGSVIYVVLTQKFFCCYCPKRALERRIILIQVDHVLVSQINQITTASNTMHPGKGELQYPFTKMG